MPASDALHPTFSALPSGEGLVFRRDFYDLGVAPEAFEVVVGAGFFLEDVDNEVAVVYQHPFAAVVAFYADRRFASAFELDVDLVANGLVLFGTGASADDEIVAEAGNFAKIEHLDVDCFLGFGRSNCSEPTW